MRTPLQDFVNDLDEGRTNVRVGAVFSLEEIVEAHQAMENNTPGGKILVLG